MQLIKLGDYRFKCFRAVVVVGVYDRKRSLDKLLCAQNGVHRAEGLGSMRKLGSCLGEAVGGLKGVVDLYACAALDAVAEQSLDIVKYLGLDYQNKLIEACRNRVINGVLHEYLAVRAETLYLLDTAVA